MGYGLRTGLGVALLIGALGATGAAGVLIGRARPDAPTPGATPSPATSPVRVAAKPAPVAPSPDAPPDAMVVRRILQIDGPFTHGRWLWDESGAPRTGPIVITIDLDAQVLSIFRDGYEIGTAVVLYGADWKPTPLGALTITQKDADHVSNLYDAPMPYMLRLTDDGISIHGSQVVAGGATHGCIGVPIEFAKKLFAATKLGDRVIITNGKRLEMGGAIAKR
ncbi:L,D-transpeptidase family protein [Sphingomonas silueang]|uniref:L,D-transpeptidase family protein n=1 Tax=Sphingomonas silueang TaxID=3156617 RepID=UPI0032B32F69